MRGSFALATLVVLLLPATASATSPLPAFTITQHRPEEHYKNDALIPEVPEICWWREIICAGPYDPASITGRWITFRVYHNETNATVGHTPGQNERLGPYVVPVDGSDDVRVCWRQCALAFPIDAHARGRYNASVELMGMNVTREVSFNFTHTFPGQVPRTYGCEDAQPRCPNDP